MQGPRLPSHSHGDQEHPPFGIYLIPPTTKSYDERNQQSSYEDSILPKDGRSEEEKEDMDGKKEGALPPILPVRANGNGAAKWRTLLVRQAKFLGPGIIAAVAYVDPGNWATDLASGSRFGYSQLFVVLFSGLIALLFQILATRLGSVTGLDLAQQCRVALYDRPKHKMLYRWGALYPLYALSEGGIILTDLAELLGSAIAINLIFPAIPLPACVVLTSLDVILILLLFDQYPTKFVSRSMRLFELMIGVLVTIVLGSFIALLVKVKPDYSTVFRGYVPSQEMIAAGGLYSAVSILGATVMPHGIYLGSKMATMLRIDPTEYENGIASEAGSSANSACSIQLPPTSTRTTTQITYAIAAPLKRPSLACVKAHLPHAQFDIALSLLGFALVINSSILIVSAAVFFYGSGSAVVGDGGISNLFDAYDLVRDLIGPAFGYLFAVGLFAAGQAASLTVTLSGQIISEGFIEWRTTPWKRRAVTRAIGIVPSLVVAIAVGKPGIDSLLIGSQVGLSIVLPFVIAPLVIFTSSHFLMAIPTDNKAASKLEVPSLPPSTNDLECAPPTNLAAATPPPYFFPSIPSRKSYGAIARTLNPFRRRENPEGTISFVNGVAVVYLSVILFFGINAANLYALVELGMGVN